MATYSAKIQWNRDGAKFSDGRYSRKHSWIFDGGLEVSASSSPLVVPVPMSDAAAVDPEEAFVASLASCHMLWFLALAGKAGFVVDSYVDDAIGTMGKNAEGKQAMLQVKLRPRTTFVGESPTTERLIEIHHRAHEECFIANSVRTEVVCEPAD